MPQWMTKEWLAEREAKAKAGKGCQAVAEVVGPMKPASKRIRQSEKPLMNKLETEWYQRPNEDMRWMRCQAITFKLANGVRFTPDFVWLCSSDRLRAYEIKGKHAWDDSLVKLKFAATAYPQIEWYLCWKQNGQWQEQRVLP
jgi:hypothetical protein